MRFSESGVESAFIRTSAGRPSGGDLLGGKSLDDAAIGDEPLPAAAGAEAAQFAGQPGQIGELLFDRTAMLLRNAIHFGACLRFLRRQAKQIPDLVEREAQVPATADEMKPPPMFRTIRPVVSIRARGDGHQSDLFVIADRHNLDAGFARKFPDGERLRRWHRLTL